VISGASVEECQEFGATSQVTAHGDGDVRIAQVTGLDGRTHKVTAGFGVAGLTVQYEVDGKLVVDGRTAV
jgi:hypothetical protein